VAGRPITAVGGLDPRYSNRDATIPED
jgi:hypothetical protein